MSDSNNPNDVLRLHDPEALQRENASLREKLTRLEKQNVVEGRFAGEAPRYLVNDPGVFIDDTHFPGGTTIDYIGTPNLSLVPLNDPAKRVMDDFILRLEDGARRVAARNGRDFHGLVGDRNQLLDLAMLDAKKAAAETPVPVIQTPMPTQGVPAMPHLDGSVTQQRRGPGRPPKIVSSTPAGFPAGPEANAPKAPPRPTDPAIVGRMVST